MAGGRPLQTISAHRGAVYSLAVRPDGRQFATGGENGLVRTWNPETGLADLPLIDRGTSISALAYEPESTALASGSMDGTVRVWSATSGRRRLGPISHPDHLTSLAFSPDAHFLSGGGGKESGRNDFGHDSKGGYIRRGLRLGPAAFLMSAFAPRKVTRLLTASLSYR